MAALPTLVVEIAFGDTTLETAPTWTAITDYVRAGAIRFGRSSELDDFQTGALSLTLDNRDRRFDPFHTTGPYYADLKSRCQIRVRATWSGTTYDLFYGFVAGFPLAPSITKDSVCEIVAYDGLGYLSQADLPSDLFTVICNEIVTAPAAWYPMGSSTVSCRDTQDTYHFTFTNTPKNGGAASDFMAGAGTQFDGTFGAIGPVIAVSGTYSIGFLFKTTTAGPTGGLNPIVCSSDPTDPISIGIDDAGRLAYRRGSGNDANSGFIANNDIWHHGLITYAGSGGAKVYVDGVLLSSGSGTGSYGAGINMIGISNQATDATYFTGELAHVQVWDSELTNDEAKYLYEAAINGGYYQPSGSTRLYKTADVIGLLLTASDWPSAWRTVEAATVVPSGIKLGNNALSVIQTLARTERGRVFVDASGDVNIQSATHDFTDSRSTTSQATYSDSGVAGTVPYSAVGEIVYSDVYLANRVTVNSARGVGSVADDATSQAQYGVRARQIDTFVDSQDDAQTYADTVVQRYASPELRINGWAVFPQSLPATAFPKVLDMRLTDRVTFEIQPNNVGTRISQPLIVEEYTHEFTPDTWTTMISGSPALSAWLLEDATYGLLETSTVLG
jgi:hypothetical protein